MTHDVSIEIKKSDGKIIAIGQIALPEEVVDGDLLVTITTTELKEERNPLHPEALTLADLKVGMKIRVGSTVIPLVRLGDKPDYIMGYLKTWGRHRTRRGVVPGGTTPVMSPLTSCFFFFISPSACRICSIDACLC